jgi:hypothetical protein
MMGLFDLFRRKPVSVWDALQSTPEFQEQKELFDAMSAMSENGIDADEIPNGVGEFGFVPTNPIPCKTVFGSTAYLGRLRAADGTKIENRRLGSTQSDASPHPIDEYEITHSTGLVLGKLYISPYQKRISTKAPRGFMLAENSFATVTPVQEIVTESDGTLKYFSCGVLHRDDGPAVIEIYPDYVGPERHRSWYRFGILHRDDGPAVVGGHETNGQYEWWRAGIRHRDDGPAIIELIESSDFGRGPVYEWWTNGIQKKVQDGDGVISYFKDGEIVLQELPDGRRIVERDGDSRYEDADGNDLGEAVPGLWEAYEGYLQQNECSHPLYSEPQITFDICDPPDNRSK